MFLPTFVVFEYLSDEEREVMYRLLSEWKGLARPYTLNAAELDEVFINGAPIMAIRMVRSRYGIPLKQALEVVNTYRRAAGENV